VAAENTLRVDEPTMQGLAQALCEVAEGLRNRLADLDAQVAALLGDWRGASGCAYASAWELWRRGAGEVEVGLSVLARLVADAGGVYQQNEAASAQALREVGHG
jgi:ESAT-6 family protein